ncbi:MAG TPA: Holliday junction branch migration protein RuvA, partial [Chloroflexota bacterium]|nr:Holliday junction branch migration protein RuvA [Chloroflexota bacterium]
MIAGLRGVLEEVGPDFLLVDVRGVVYRVFSATSTLYSVGEVGSPVSFHTHLQVREDGVTLFGFATRAELQLFQLLTTVTSVGPRIALALLSAMPVDDLVGAIESQDTVRLSSVTGVGKRIAARIALELKGKLGMARGSGAAVLMGGGSEQLLAALTT